MSKPVLRCFPFGGVGEFGKNMMVYAIDDDAVIVDCGMGFPEPGQHGVDIVVPDISALDELGLHIHAMLLTHGHEDHIGGLPHLLPRLNLPVYGSEVTIALVRAKLSERGYRGDLNLLPDDGTQVDVGPFKVEGVPVTHSIMDAVSVAIHTELGVIIHTGDFKFDPAPIDGRATAIHRFSQLGDQGVLLLASDSTNATRSGSGASERVVGPALKQAVSQCSGKVVVTTFASNMFRIQQIVDAAVACGRRVAVAGRSLERNMDITRNLNRLNVPAGTMVDIKQTEGIAAHELLIIATGSQGESRAALARLAQDRFTGLKLGQGDLVIFSSSSIPGNERVIAGLYNHIYRRGARIMHAGQAPLHVSGHAQAHELKMMIQLTRPDYFYPVHGEYRNLIEHRDLAVATGIAFDHSVIAENGYSVIIDEQGVRHGPEFHAGAVFVDGDSRDEIDDLVLRDRRVLAGDGMISVTVLLSRHEGRLLSEPELVARGVLHEDVSDDVLSAAGKALQQFLEGMDREWLADMDSAKEEVRLFLRRWCKKHIGRRPMVLPVILAV
ncbi:ribonuclease J [Mariprofundus ferrinatatus]|uniref:Ribonuclease J n=1 Tax=Mariprofundus ferrinatatus TaxID=1921087 RepID=A0A2K8L4B4_9PROT|nr:ribonuclease J [Mariprofundus ferrinatatus]ATX82165.1 ribonuclease J [Mariprofundus ferrinatatus]